MVTQSESESESEYESESESENVSELSYSETKPKNINDDSNEFDDSGKFTIVLMTKKWTHCF